MSPASQDTQWNHFAVKRISQKKTFHIVYNYKGKKKLLHTGFFIFYFFSCISLLHKNTIRKVRLILNRQFIFTTCLVEFSLKFGDFSFLFSFSAICAGFSVFPPTSFFSNLAETSDKTDLWMIFSSCTKHSDLCIWFYGDQISLSRSSKGRHVAPLVDLISLGFGVEWYDSWMQNVSINFSWIWLVQGWPQAGVGGILFLAEMFLQKLTLRNRVDAFSSK